MYLLFFSVTRSTESYGVLDRQHFQQLTQLRIEDAEELLSKSRWSAAYYLAGYALECALKSCALARLEQNIDVFFADKKYQLDCWTHDLEKLVRKAELLTALAQESNSNQIFGTNWLIAKDWTEGSRYQVFTQRQAENLYNAINDQPDGVLSWIKIHW
jgi:hypothetical protein